MQHFSKKKNNWVQQLVFFSLITKNHNSSNMYISDTRTVDLQKNDFLSWILLVKLSEKWGFPFGPPFSLFQSPDFSGENPDKKYKLETSSKLLVHLFPYVLLHLVNIIFLREKKKTQEKSSIEFILVKWNIVL